MAQEIVNVGATANDGTGDPWRDAFIKVVNNFAELFGLIKSKQIIVTEGSQLSGVLSSTRPYFLDGIIDVSLVNISVPSGGLSFAGYDNERSGLISTSSNHTMFVSPAGNSGSLFAKACFFEASGSGSQVYDLTDETGNNAIEVSEFNYNNCTSLGTLNGYRQGLELNTGRFGGTPELTLAGTWAGGFFIDTSIVRSLTDGAYSLFKAGGGFAMDSRFRSNQNIDLPASANFLDFAAANFPNSSTLQLEECIITRDGVSDASDANITPNITAGDLASDWTENNGMQNTFEGGEASITTEVETVINTVDIFEDMQGAYTTVDLQHFDSPSSGQLRHLGSSPIEFKVIVDVDLDGGANDEVSIKIVVFRDSTTSFEDAKEKRKVVNNLQGGRDVAYFGFQGKVTLNQNDYVKLQVANHSNTTNLTAELSGSFSVEAR